jgi:hypothetical protein
MHPSDIDTLVSLFIVLDFIELPLSLSFKLSMLPLKISQLLLDLLALSLPLCEPLIERRILLIQPFYFIFKVLNFSFQLLLVSIRFRVIIIELLLQSSVLDSLVYQIFTCV